MCGLLLYADKADYMMVPYLDMLNHKHGVGKLIHTVELRPTDRCPSVVCSVV